MCRKLSMALGWVLAQDWVKVLVMMLGLERVQVLLFTVMAKSGNCGEVQNDEYDSCTKYIHTYNSMPQWHD